MESMKRMEKTMKSKRNRDCQIVIMGKNMVDIDEKANEFIEKLSVLTAEILNNKNGSDFFSDYKALKKLFDSFAIIDEFTDFLIIDCFNEIKISMMKWERFTDKCSPVALEFKKLLDHFYEVMKDLYFYEIFGFFSTTVHPEDFPELNIPCKVFCGCADGWQKEPYLDDDGNVKYINVVRFQDPKNKDILLSIIIGGSAELLDPREKCSLTDKELRTLCNFVNHHRGSIILHNAGVIDSKQFLDSLKLRDRINKSKYCIEFEYIKHIDSVPQLSIPSCPFYVDLDDMSYDEAKRFYKKIWKEIKSEPENLRASYRLFSLKVIKCRPPLNQCCFCSAIMKDYGNSTWPIYYKRDAEYYRCCADCNEKYVIAARKNRKQIMHFRKQFGIDYTEYTD